MPITIYSDVVMPNSVLAAGLAGSNLRSNTRTVNKGGFAHINADWSKTLRQFDIGLVPMLPSEWSTIEGLHEITAGGAYGFLMEDPKDATATALNGLLRPYTTAEVGSTGFGFGVPAYKLKKRYSAVGTAQTADRAITRPKAAGLGLLRNGASVTLGGAAGQAQIDVLTGTVNFAADQLATVSAITTGASTSITLSVGIGLVTGNRLWLQALTGADAALLNGLSHEITALAGNVYTLAVNTAGKTISPTGQGHRYPQSSESLHWRGGFYVPVHFVHDALDWAIVRGGQADTRLIVGQSVMLQEVRE